MQHILALASLVAAACTSSPPSPASGPLPPPPPPPARSDRVFVSQAGSSTLAVIDGASGALEARIEVGMLPHNLVLSPDRRTLYAALVGSQAIAEVDVASAHLRRTFLTAPVPERRPADGSVIQAHLDGNAFSASTCYGCHRPGGAQPKYAGDRPFGLLLSPDGRRLYVAHLRASRLAVLNLDDGSIERTVLLAPAGAATEAVALAWVNQELWVALRPPQPSNQAGAVRRLDAATLEPLGELPTGSDPGMLLALPARGRILVSNFETDTVTMFQADGAGAAARFTVAPGPLGLLALPAGGALALDYYSNAVSFLDLDSGGARTLPLERGGVPYANPTNAALASDQRSAWIVSSGTDGHLLELELASGALVHDFPIDGLSFGVAVVPRESPVSAARLFRGANP